jgi:tRNA(Arg) A34 adenosine deaminase TadA
MDTPRWKPRAEDGALARELGPNSAFLAWGDRWFHARDDRAPILALARGIWELDPERARSALRNRVRLTAPVRPLDRAVADVVAKRVSWVPPDAGSAPASHDVSALAARALGRVSVLDVGERRVPADPAGWLRSLVPAGDPGPLALRDRPVVSVLLDGAGEVVVAATNAAGRNRTLHAEACLTALRAVIPDGWTVLTSLQPCRMCAALLVDAAAGALAVRYLDPDPGRLATRTALQERGWEHRL